MAIIDPESIEKAMEMHKSMEMHRQLEKRLSALSEVILEVRKGDEEAEEIEEVEEDQHKELAETVWTEKQYDLLDQTAKAVGIIDRNLNKKQTEKNPCAETKTKDEGGYLTASDAVEFEFDKADFEVDWGTVTSDDCEITVGKVSDNGTMSLYIDEAKVGGSCGPEMSEEDFIEEDDVDDYDEYEGFDDEPEAACDPVSESNSFWNPATRKFEPRKRKDPNFWEVMGTSVCKEGMVSTVKCTQCGNSSHIENPVAGLEYDCGHCGIMLTHPESIYVKDNPDDYYEF